jgi:transcriptional regulator with XRE-family HTH domain
MAVVDLANWSRSRKLERSAAGRSELGRLLRDLRVGAGLTVHALAQRAGLDPSTVSAIEHGRRGATRSVLRRLWLASNGEADDLDRLLASAGLLPESVVDLGGWDRYVRIWRGQVKTLERKLELRDAALVDQGRKLADLLGPIP